MLPDDVLKANFSFKRLFVPLTTFKAILIIIIAGVILLGNAIFNNFVLDDYAQVIDNPLVHSVRNFPAFFTGSTFYNGNGQSLTGQYYKPLLSTFFAIIYTVFGANYYAYHILQLLLITINASFVYLVLKFFLRNITAFFISLVFLVHPINSEVAFYISDFQEVLMFLCGIVSIWILQFHTSKKSILLALIFLFFSLLFKETGILFFIIVIIYLFLFKRRAFFIFFKYSIFMLVLYFALRISAIGLSTTALPNSPIQTLGLTDRLLNMPAIYLFYLKTFVFPINLATSYHWIYTHADFIHFFAPLIIAILSIIILYYFGFLFYKKSSKLYFNTYSFFCIWFILGILFHLQFFPLDQTVAERWFYFPIVGLLAMIGLLYDVYRHKMRRSWFLVGILTILLLLMYSIRTFTRSFDWRNNFVLTSHDIKVSKEAYNLENVLSAEYYLQGRCTEAKTHSEKSIQIFPFITNYLNLGVSYACLKDYPKAKYYYLKALNYGDYILVYRNLAALSLDYGDRKESIDFIKHKALAKFPKDAILWVILARLEYTSGNRESAIDAIKQANMYDQGPSVSNIYLRIMNNQPI